MIQGQCDPCFAKVKQAFDSCFADGLEHGGAVAVMLDGKPIVDLWGGHQDAMRSKLWQSDTLINVWSVSKGVMATAIAMLVARGKLAYDAPLAQVWPEFAQNGKQAISLDLVMSHRAGLNGLDVPMDEAGLIAWTPYVTALEQMAPLWEPGSRCCYHALTYGHLTGEALRRVDGRSPGRFIAEEISRVLGLDFYIGLPESEDHRVAEMIEGPKASDWVEQVAASAYPQACVNPTPMALAPNHRAWRAAEIPGGNGHSDARSLAKLYGDLVARKPSLLSVAAREEATRERFSGVNVFGEPTAWAAGFRLADEDFGKQCAATTFGHAGWGGSIAFADPVARLGFGYVTNRMLGFDDGVDLRRQRLIEAVYEAL